MKKIFLQLAGTLLVYVVVFIVAIETLQESGAISRINNALSIVGFKIDLPNIPNLNILSILPDPVVNFLRNSCYIVQNNIFLQIILLLPIMFLTLELVCWFLVKE